MVAFVVFVVVCRAPRGVARREGVGMQGALGSPANCIKLLSVQFIASSARVSTFSYATAEVVCVWSICESLELVLLSFTLFVLFTSYYFFFFHFYTFSSQWAPHRTCDIFQLVPNLNSAAFVSARRSRHFHLNALGYGH